MKTFFFILSWIFSLSSQAQNIGIGTNAPHSSAKLHISDTNRGLLLPQVSLININNGTTPVNIPATGLLVWNTNATVTGGNGTGFYYWNGSQWISLRSNIGANNGLSLIAGSIELGGNLTHGTTVNCDGSALTFEDASGDYGFNITNGGNIFALMYGDNASIWCGLNELRIATPDIGAGAAVGQILQLRNAATGEVRYTPYQFPITDGSNGQILTTNGAGTLTWQSTSTGTGWALTGNSATNPILNFLGTTDARDLVIRTNNTERIRILSAGRVGINTSPNFSAQLHVNGNLMINSDQRLIVDGSNFDNWLYHDSGLSELRLESPSETVHVTGDVARISTGTESIYLSGGLNGGSIGVNTLSPTAMFDINGNNGYDQLRLRRPYTPSSSADANGNTGDVSWDNDYIYIKTSLGWRRSALSTF